MKFVKKIMEVLLTTFFSILFKFNKTQKDIFLEKTIDLYKDKSFNGVFAKIRAWDAPYKEIDKRISKKSLIVDLGSGDGLLANYLAQISKNRKIYGIELNPTRVDVSQKGLKNTHFKQGSILKTSLPKADVFILAHVLHHLPSKRSQELLLEKLSNLLGKNKKIVILEIDNVPLFKFLFTWFTDAFIVPILFEGRFFTNKFYYRKRKEWYKLLTKIGFKVKMKLVNKGMPFSHVLIEAIKK